MAILKLLFQFLLNLMPLKREYYGSLLFNKNISPTMIYTAPNSTQIPLDMTLMAYQNDHQNRSSCYLVFSQPTSVSLSMTEDMLLVSRDF